MFSASHFLFRKGFYTVRYASLLSGHTIYSMQQSHQMQTRVPHMTTPTNDRLNYELLVRKDVADVYENIRKNFKRVQVESVLPLASYHLDGDGKCLRPLVILCLAKAINSILKETSPKVIENQKKVAQVAEMIHGTCLYHDDVIDDAIKRRAKPTINFLCGQKKSIWAGGFVLGRALETISQIPNNEVCILLTRMIQNVVTGELMQLDAGATEEERYSQYIDKTFKKTASVFAYSCQAVLVLAGADATLQTTAFEFGRQLGIAYQLVDDIIDFSAIASTEYGKALAVDLNQGLANMPVLFAAQQFPELNPMILRRFKEPGDVATAYSLILKSDGLQRTKELATQYYGDAMDKIAQLSQSPYQEMLFTVTHQLLNKIK
ncbi:all trans-polyprenyl-diphosphate synthase PDSS1-like [Daphnia pulex]|uniref:all trans-polyprenyl-diphosphate synthase PDSS1-like n=1 Tax=Daphnia pulex TaxID=6669 RepID=UPI001EDD96F9|nr:all trans-polyprenyl-diphosphate synthase PDSS1-like [Daphnia pulex]